MSHGADTTAAEVLEGLDLDGRNAVVTGASTGIGFETARALAGAGADVITVARTREKAVAACAAIAQDAPRGRVQPGWLDLGSLASVRRFSEWYLQQGRALHILVNNAGVMYPPFGRTEDGFETQFGVNHLGHFVLTNRLVPALIAGAPSRVVNVSSAGHRSSDIVWDDPNHHHRPYDKFEAYGQSKTANILFTVALDRRLAPSGVRVYAVHPGMIPTDLGRHMTRADMAELRERARRGPAGALPAYKSLGAGAATSVWAATAPELAEFGGAYLADCSLRADAAPFALDPVAAERLWSLSEDLVGERFLSG